MVIPPVQVLNINQEANIVKHCFIVDFKLDIRSCNCSWHSECTRTRPEKRGW